MESPSNKTKIAVLVSNILGCALGCIFVACGTWILIFMSPSHDLDANPSILAIVFITLGALINLASFIGCYVLRSGQYRKIIFIYGSLSALLIIGEIIFIGLSYHYKKPIQMYSFLSLKETLDQYGNNTKIDQMWDQMQSKLGCCGIGNVTSGNAESYKNGYLDWKHAKKWQSKLLRQTNSENLSSVPDSCCRAIDVGYGRYNSTTNRYTKEINKIGCLVNLVQVVGTMICVAVLEDAWRCLRVFEDA